MGVISGENQLHLNDGSSVPINLRDCCPNIDKLKLIEQPDELCLRTLESRVALESPKGRKVRD